MTTKLRTPLLACLLGAASASPSWALPPGFAIEQVHAPVNFPTALRFAPDGRLFFTELTGRVAFYPSLSFPTSVTWTTLDVGLGGERGAHGLAIHPDYPDSPYVYVQYTHDNPLVNRLVRFRDELGGATEPAVLFELPAAADNHHGGRLAFGPDGMIYVSYGDQANESLTQDPSSPVGKVFRLGRGGKPAPGNPWGASNPACLMGIRNVYGLCFDPQDGTGYFTENGPDCDDEINLIALGADYGWGLNDFCGGEPSGTFPPLARISPTIAPTGCCVYRESVYPDRFDGTLFFGAFNDFRIYRVRFKPGQPDQVDTLDVFAQMSDLVLDVTVGPDGFLWVATTSSIWRITYTPPTVGVAPPPAAAAVSLSLGPNPARGAVQLAARGVPPGARLEILDPQGRRIRAWEDPIPERVTWDGRSDRGHPSPVGIYLVRLSGPGFQITRRLVRLGR